MTDTGEPAEARRDNRRYLGELLERNPGFARPLAHSGSAALAAYASFLEDCWNA